MGEALKRVKVKLILSPQLRNFSTMRNGVLLFGLLKSFWQNVSMLSHSNSLVLTLQGKAVCQKKKKKKRKKEKKI